jgi:hypothetical protein
MDLHNFQGISTLHRDAGIAIGSIDHHEAGRIQQVSINRKLGTNVAPR